MMLYMTTTHLISKEKGGLGVSSFYALNRALLFKWVWCFRTQGSSIWARVIKGIHGEDGKLGKNVNHSHPSIWLDIVREMEQPLKNHFKMSHENLGDSLRRIPMGGIEHVQFLEFLASMEGVALVDMRDRWVWSLEGSGEFSVASVRRYRCKLRHHHQSFHVDDNDDFIDDEDDIPHDLVDYDDEVLAIFDDEAANVVYSSDEEY
ncbi:hypothetical protein Tco_1514640 [Tanacetum coccineum]